VNVGKAEAREVAEALRNDIDQVFRPAFNLLMGARALDKCGEIEDVKHALTCLQAVKAVLGDEEATRILKTSFRMRLEERVGERLKELVQGSEEREAVERFHRELQAFVGKRDAGTVVQLLAPQHSLASFVLMLWALSSGDEELARAHAKLMSITLKEKLPRRLFREAAETRGEGFELALLKLFYYYF